MIRVFLTTWSVQAGVLVHGLTGVIDSVPDQQLVPPTERFRARLLSPDADADGLPDQPSVMLIINGDSTIEAWAELPGVDMLPPFALNQLIADIPTATVGAVIAALESHGIPYPAVQGSATAGDLLDRIIAYYRVTPVRVTEIFAGAEGAFS